MIRRIGRCLAVAICFGISATSLKATPDLDTARRYFGICFEIQKAEDLGKKSSYLEALVRFKWSAVRLDELEKDRPGWEEKLITERIKYCDDEMVKLKPLAATQILASYQTSILPGPPISSLFDEGVELEARKIYREALIKFDEFETSIEVIHQSFPSWNSEAIHGKIQEGKAATDRVRGLALEER